MGNVKDEERKEKCRKYSKEWHLKNKEKINEKKRIYYSNNKEKMRERKREYILKNKEKINQKRKERRLKNREKINQKNREKYKNNKYQLKYYIENKERVKEVQKKYRLNNKEKIKEIQKQYRLNNKDKKIKYIKDRLKNDLNFKLAISLRNRIREVIKNKNCKKSIKFIELLGCDVDEARKHLEKQFKEGMTWENHGEWHIDHIIPCASFDLTDPEQQKKCFHYTNLQPLWAKENLSKGCRI